ncbi:hypothetical protein EYF80_009578 [Liparis tanakae]|uniref:Uncharacterized protein n=1 Tax=Liparis tanakae TaxID=230148 RepID=A0A4Z2ISU6_9TELE|nr:hypothetical protein EYF80_009578 [Liparis tanakae]
MEKGTEQRRRSTSRSLHDTNVKRKERRYPSGWFPHRVQIGGQLLDGGLQVVHSFQTILKETEQEAPISAPLISVLIIPCCLACSFFSFSILVLVGNNITGVKEYTHIHDRTINATVPAGIWAR